MSTEQSVKKFKRDAARYGLFMATWFFRWLPYSVIRAISQFFISIGFALTVAQKKVARDSLRIAFRQQKTDEEIEDITKQCFYNLGRGMIELIYSMEHPKIIKTCVSIEGKEILDNAFKQGNGVIVVSAHFGNFPLMLLHLAQRGYKTNAIIRKARDKIIEKYFFEKRSSLGLNTIYSLPRIECVNRTIKALRNNELVFIPLDQNFGSGGGVFVDFFGQKAATATGPIVFARRTKAPIIPVFIVRDGKDHHKIIVEKPMELSKIDDEKEMIHHNIAKITGIIENYIRQYPHEWGWMHRRWKTRPYEVKYMPNA